MTLRDMLLAIAVAAIWGGNFVVMRLGVDEMPPFLLTALRFLFSAFPAVFFIARPKAPARLVVAYGLFLGVGQFGSLFMALKLGMPTGLASLVVQTQVFFTIALSAATFGERPTRLQMIAGLCAIAGIVIIGSDTSAQTPLLPFLIVLLGAFSWAIANVIAKKARGADMLSFVVWSSLASPVPLLLLSLAMDGAAAVSAPLLHPTWTAVLCIFVQAVPATIFGFSVWSQLLNRYSAATVAPFALLIPIFGLLSGWLFLGERPFSIPVIVGALLVLLALSLNVFGPRLLRFRR